MSTRDEDFVTSIFVANTHAILLVFTDRGKVFPLQVYDVPETGRDARGRPIVNLVPVPAGERVASVVSVRDLEEEGTSLVFFSRQGLVKKTALNAFRNLRSGGMRAAGVADDDELLLVRMTDDQTAHAMLFSQGGKCIRFPLANVPSFGRSARGNLGIKLEDDDMVVDGIVVPAEDPTADGDTPPSTTLLTVTEFGYGSRTPFEAYRVQGRNGKGILSFRPDEDTGRVIGAVEVAEDDQLMLVTNTGRVIRFGAASVSLTVSRAVKGVRLMRLETGEAIVDLARLEEEDDVEDEGEGESAEAPTEGDATTE